MGSYVLITPAHNEEALIARTIESIVAQTIRPIKWVVVNDASSDRTSEVVESYARDYPFIELINIARTSGRHFGHKARAFQAGFERMKGLSYGFIGNLDADISLETNYFEDLLRHFEADLRLGVAGGMVHTAIDGEFVSQRVALDSVAGAVQLFRRECFEQVGGYQPLPNGGIDAAAEIAARLHGWKTRTFPELQAKEHRRTGSATSGALHSRIKEGKRMYSLGYSPWFFCVRCAYRSLEQPAMIGSIAAAYAFLKCAFARLPHAVPPEMVQFLRQEQHSKLKGLLKFWAL